MYASRKVTMITWAKEWGPGFPGEEGGAHTLEAAQGTPDTYCSRHSQPQNPLPATSTFCCQTSAHALRKRARR